MVLCGTYLLHLKGVNDSLEDAARLIKLTEGIAAKINLIHFNPHSGTDFRGSDDATIASFNQVRIYTFLTCDEENGVN